MSLQKKWQANKAKPAAVAEPTPTPSNEDMDLDATLQVSSPIETVEPNPSNVAEVAQAYDRLEAKAEADAMSDAEGARDGLDEIGTSINEDNATGGLTMESLVFAGHAVGIYSRRLGIESTPLVAEFTASVESAIAGAKDGKAVVSTESLVASVEAVDNVAAYQKKRRTAASLRSGGASIALGHMKILRNKIDEVVDEVRKIENLRQKRQMSSSKRVSIAPRWVSLATGTVSKDIPGDFIRSAEFLLYIIRDFDKQAKTDFDANVDLVKELKEAKSPEEASKIFDKIASNWKDPRVKLGDKASERLIGGYQLFEDQTLKYHGSNAAAKKLDRVANLAYPELGYFQVKDHQLFKGEVDVPALSPAQIVAIGNRLKKVLEAVSGWSHHKESGAAMSTDFSKLFLGTVGAVLLGVAAPAAVGAAAGIGAVGAGVKMWRRGAAGRATSGTDKHLGREEVDVLKDAMKTANRLRFHVGTDASLVLGYVCQGFLKMAKLSIKAYLTHSVESLGNNNAIDGVTVNEGSQIDPDQVPGDGNTAPVKDETKPVETINDLAQTEQDLDGAVNPKAAAAEDTEIQKANVNEVQQSMESIAATPAKTGKAIPYWMIAKQQAKEIGYG